MKNNFVKNEEVLANDSSVAKILNIAEYMQIDPFRSSRSQMFLKLGVLKNFINFTGKHFCWSLQVYNFIKKRFQHSCFPVKFVKFLRRPFFKEHFRWLLLSIGGKS